MLLGPTFTSAQNYSVLRRCTAGATVFRQKMITSRCHGLFYARLESGGHNNHRRHVWKYINNLINDGNKFEQRYFLLVFRWRREPAGGFFAAQCVDRRVHVLGPGTLLIGCVKHTGGGTLIAFRRATIRKFYWFRASNNWSLYKGIGKGIDCRNETVWENYWGFMSLCVCFIIIIIIVRGISNFLFRMESLWLCMKSLFSIWFSESDIKLNSFIWIFPILITRILIWHS